MPRLTALLILVACQQSLALQYPRTPRELFEDSLQALLERQSNPVRRIVTCSKALGVSKCFSALAVWRADRALKILSKNSTAHFNLVEDVEQFPWKKYENETNDQLQVQLLDSTQRLLRYRPLTFDMMSGCTAKLSSKSDGSFNIDIQRPDESVGRGSMKKIQKGLQKFLPIVLAPGLFIAALLPFVLPSLKMMILMVAYMNQVALIGAIFTILVNNAFNSKPTNHKVVYVNSGYKNENSKYVPSNDEQHFHTNDIGFLYEDYKTPSDLKLVGGGPLEENYGNFEEMHAVKPEWFKDYPDSKVISLLPNQANGDIYLNQEIPTGQAME